MSEDAVRGAMLLAAIAAVGVGFIVYGSTQNAFQAMGSILVTFVGGLLFLALVKRTKL